MLPDWYGLRRRWDSGPFLENAPPILHAPDIQLSPLLPPAIQSRALPTAQSTKVRPPSSLQPSLDYNPM